jgi:hypothetical protein
MEQMKKILAPLLGLATVLMCVTAANASIIPLMASMDGDQADAGAGTGSGGRGTATITFDDVSNLLSWSIVWSGLDGDPTLMHFHGPALPNQNAGVQVGTGVAGPPVVGDAVLTAPQAADLLAGLWYLNLHTTTSPGGEIRGTVTVVPEPGTALLVGGGLVVLGMRRRS